MCCSMRATVFFLTSLHIYFSLTQAVGTMPFAVSSISKKTPEAVLAIIYAIVFASSGIITFRGADEESPNLVGGGAVVMFVILVERFTIQYFSLMLVPELPEGAFLYVYGTTVPVIFTVLLYLFYFSILFCYHNELKYSLQQACLSPINGRRSPRHHPGTPDTDLP